ncbi:hypothetical protein [Burkholderia cepacia]|uniref:hypothetical protein n=1 Tax=Burkholderia cepacia TaxID=292 RepID=UPI00265175DF|nr:hypothetical protein [Burkholderia cepacia]MDN7634083.1 hypothetical protein [Burkholderia cepacia]
MSDGHLPMRHGNGKSGGSARLHMARSEELLASVTARQGTSDAILRRILVHAPTRDDVLHRHCVSLEAREVAGSLEEIQGV